MGVFRSIGLHSVAWSLRRLYCPVSRSALVLEVGSGGNPFPRSDVLLDAYEETRERHWEPLCKDRPVVLGFAEELPFKDKAFDYVIACHVLEHSSDPATFLSELQRVAKAGYIEVPGAFMERIIPYLDHKLEIMKAGNKLLINKKPKRIVDPWFHQSISSELSATLLRSLKNNPFEFHVQLYWNSEIVFAIANEQQVYSPDANDEVMTPAIGSGNSLRRKVLKGFSYLLRGKGKGVGLEGLLQCPKCRHGDLLKVRSGMVKCRSCSTDIRFFDANLVESSRSPMTAQVQSI